MVAETTCILQAIFEKSMIVFNNKFLDYLNKKIYPSQPTVEKADKIRSPGRLS